MIIGISGKIGSGKDTAGKIITELMPSFEVKKYADKLKYIVSILIGCSKEELENQNFKMNPCSPEWQHAIKHAKTMTPRLMLQLIGTEGGRDLIHHNIWVNALFADYNHGFNADEEVFSMPDWVITDMRFPNELDAVKQRGGITIRIERGAGNTGDHPSETALDNAQFDHRLDNNGTLENLRNDIVTILTMEGISYVDR